MRDYRKDEVIRMVASLKPGQTIQFSAIELIDKVGGYWHNGVFFSPADTVMENIIGSSYEYSYTESLTTGAITFRRLEAPIDGDSGELAYISPDRRPKYKAP
jgi:hypothetical protein